MRSIRLKPGQSVSRTTNHRWLRPTLITVGVLVSVFVLANAAIWFSYRNRVLPKYQVGAIDVGSVPYDQLNKKVPQSKILPEAITLSKGDKHQALHPQDIGVTVDWPATRQKITDSKPWLPVLSVLMHKSIPAELTVDSDVFSAGSQELKAFFAQAALPERIAFSGENFATLPPEAGYQLDTSRFKQQLLAALELGKKTLDVPTTVTTAAEPTGQLAGQLTELQSRLNLNLTFTHNGQNRRLTKAEIGGLYEPSGQTMQPSEASMGQLAAKLGQELKIESVNQSGAVQALAYALRKGQPVTFSLAKQGKIYRYCTNVRGVETSFLSGFNDKLAAVYGDPRGWNSGGKLTLVRVDSGCDYTAWLSAPGQMTSFGGVCDSYYSCRSGNNVVVNFDRWQGATDPWNAAGGSLEDYRVMVINHETGHWLGFGHRTCPAPGQSAPVMQQQSINLGGCTFNPWPTAAELSTLAQTQNL